MRRTLASALTLGLLACATGLYGRADASPLAYPVVGGAETPELVLAQRAIERSWGESEDSVYVEREIPNWRSEGLALTLSAAVPGLGQAYAGETTRGLMFAAVEVLGWMTRQIHRKRGDDLREQAVSFMGTPNDPHSFWSFQRWEAATQGDAADLRALFDADPEAFYDLIAQDPRYAAGWYAEDSRRHFSSMRDISDDRLRVARFTEAGLWINHVVAALDALRASRVHNLPLLQGLELKTRNGWRSGGPALSVAFVGRF